MTEFSYVVTHITSSPDVVVTNDVESIELVDSGTGEIKSAKITLNALFGKYITSTPVIEQFDQFKISITDDASNTYEQIYEVDRLTPIKNAGEGYKLEIELLGQEQHLQKIDVAKQFYFESAAGVTSDIIDFYNDIKGSSQPQVINFSDDPSFLENTNELPKWTANNYEFGVAEIKAYDALLHIVEGLGASVANGGAGDFFELYFDSNTADPTKIKFKAFSSGSKPASGSEVTISDSVAVNEAPTEGGIDAITGTVIKAWGRKGLGTLPNSVQDFSGQLEAFLLHPDYESGVTYPVGARVQKDGTHYQANTETSQTPPHPNWTTKTFADIQGASNGYSLWTESKVNEWKSSGSDPSNSNYGVGCHDSNLVIDDGTYFQSWVHVKSTNPDNSNVNIYKYSGLSSGNYRGLRVLCNSTGVGDFSGNDKFGKAYSNNICEYNGSEWIVKYVTSDDNRCAVLDEGKVYEKQSGTWTDISGAGRENHCFHPTSVANVAGYNSTSDGSGTFGDNSAVEWTYAYSAFDTIPGTFFNTAGFYKIGAWANWSVPFPENSHNSNTLGELYGNNATKKEPATIDANNMHLTHSGNVGFNNSEAEELGAIDGLQFWVKLKWTDTVGNVLQGDFKMRCTLYDTDDNVVTADFVIPFNDYWHQVKLPFSSFSPYRARIPLSLRNIIPNVITPDLEILNVFQWKNIKRVAVQWQDSYDDQGRYSPESSRAVTQAVTGNTTVKLAIDAFCFTKPLCAVTAPDTTRCIEPRSMNVPDISNSVQLSQIVNSQKDIEQFQHKEFTITTPGKIDINFGDTFFLNDSNLVNDADTRTADSGGNSNTIRLVAKRISYKITKNSNGAGNFLRTILGIKRIIS